MPPQKGGNLTYELMWVDKPARALQVGDIVSSENGDCRHVLHIRRGNDEVLIVSDATPDSCSYLHLSQNTQIRVTRGGWCTNADCRYCNMPSAIVGEIGRWWWKSEQSSQEVRSLRNDIRLDFIATSQDADRALDGIDEREPVKVFYGRSVSAPENHDGKPAISASSVAELKSLASAGWQFKILRCGDLPYLPKVIMFEWCPPSEG